MNLEAITHLWNYRPRKFRSDAFLFWSRGPDSYRKNDWKHAVVWPWLVLQLSMVLALTQLGIRQSDWRRAGIRSTNLHIVVEWHISYEIALIWISLDFIDDQSTLVQVMAWCRQATSHYLSQCWPRSVTSYGITRPNWVNSFWLGSIICNLDNTIHNCILKAKKS